MKRASLRAAIGLIVMALVTPAAMAGQRGKIINVVPPKPKPKARTPANVEFPARYDGDATQLKKSGDQSGSPDAAWSITKTTAKLTWETIPDDPDLAELPVPGQRSRVLQRYQAADGE